MRAKIPMEGGQTCEIQKPRQRLAALARCAVCTLAASHPLPAFASIEYRSFYLQRDFMLFLAAMLTLILFYVVRGNGQSIRMRPIGRRLSDLTRSPGTDSSHIVWKGIDEGNSSWEALKIEAYPALVPGEATRWTITLFNVERKEPGGRFASSPNGFFTLSRTPEMAEEILGPLERKVYHRFKGCFANARIVQGSPISVTRPCYTWFPSLEPLQELMLEFLTMCVAISEDIQIDGDLTLYRGSSFWLEVTWPDVPELETLEIQLEGQETMEVVRTGERVGLRLHLTVPEGLAEKGTKEGRRRTA